MMEQPALSALVDADCRETAHALIENFVGPDHKVLNIEAFISALVQALKEAREQGESDRPGETGEFL